MVETSPSVLRVVALLACSASFAGLWSNDRPRETVALRQPAASDPFARVPVPPRSAIVQSIRVAASTKTFSLDADNLTLPRAEVDAHLSQLPLGMPAGDYRIVDPQGGVGWLRVRGGQSVAETPLLTTTVADRQMRFLRIESSRVGGTERTPSGRR